MPLGPKTKQFFETILQNPVTFKQLMAIDLPQLREDYKKIFDYYTHKPISGVTYNDFKPAQFEITDDYKIPVKIFTPENVKEPSPTIIFFHGGGFIFNLDVHWIPCSYIGVYSGCKIISVDYHLAPEYKFPHGFNDAYNSIKYCIDNADDLGIQKDKIIVMGYSSGGNLASLAVNKLANEGYNIFYQILVSTCFDLSGEITIKPQYEEKQNQDKLLTKDFLQYLILNYLKPGQTGKEPEMSPYFQPLDYLSKLPKTKIVVGEYDGIYGNSYEYYLKLKVAGVDVDFDVYKGQTHNFLIARGVLNDGRDPAVELGKEIGLLV